LDAVINCRTETDCPSLQRVALTKIPEKLINWKINHTEQ